MPPLSRYTHTMLTVSDVDASVDWYRRVFGLVVINSEEVTATEPEFRGRFRSLLHPEHLTYIGLIEHTDGDRATFDERRVGLDHFAMHVDERRHVNEWARHLDALGVPHSGIKERPYGAVITLRDPDGIQLEIAWLNLAFYAEKLAAAAVEGPGS